MPHMLGELGLAAGKQRAETPLNSPAWAAFGKNTHRRPEITRRTLSFDADPALRMEREKRPNEKIDTLHALAGMLWNVRHHNRIGFRRGARLFAQRSAQTRARAPIPALAQRLEILDQTIIPLVRHGSSPPATPPPLLPTPT